MEFIWSYINENNLVNFIIDTILLAVVLALVAFLLVKVCKRKTAIIFISISYPILVISYILALTYAFWISAILTALGVFIFFQANIGDLRKVISNPFKTASAKNESFGVQKIYDEDFLVDELYDAVSFLSKGLLNEATHETKHIGAIITFEQSQSMRDIIKNGVQLNIPVSSAILKTIFYPGTLLHDGALVIHGNTILAASVFYNPSTRSYAKKFGSRHRAAIGISEITDSLTVVVSEETGRVSFAVNGEMHSVEVSKFKEKFKDLYKKV